ncbi:MAG: cupredoxin domain-containing protein [Acidimicrobiales bacterium]
MRKLRVISRFTILTVLLVACGGDGDHENAGHDMSKMGRPDIDCSPSGATLAVSADALKFSTNCLAAPAGQPFSVAFENKENVAHNIAILGDGEKTLAGTEVFNGPKTVTLKAAPLEAGKYRFHCVVHPEMVGSFVVK